MEQIDDRQVLHIQEELIRKYRNKIESQRRMIHRQEKVIEGFRQQYLFLYREQFRDISRLLFGWNFLPPHQLESKTLYLRVERMLERLQGGADGMGDIPESINCHFDRLPAAHRSDELSAHREGGTGGDPLEKLLVKAFSLGDNLDIVNGGTVIQGDELHLLIPSLGAYPAFGEYPGARLRGEQRLDLGPFQCFHKLTKLL